MRRTTQAEFSGAVRSGVRYGPGAKARVLYLRQYQPLPYQRTAEAMRDLFGCRLSAGTVANIVRECSDGLVETELKIKRGLRQVATDVLGDLSPHDLRRTAITRALESGLSYRQVQMMSKHKDPKTVMRYDHGRENLDQNAVNFLQYEDEN